MKNYSAILKRYMNPERIMFFINKITTYQRMPASEGLYEATCWVRDTMRELGVETKILEYKADTDITYLSVPMFREWECYAARLEVEDLPEPILCDFMAQPMSVIMHSMPADFTKGAEIIYLPKDFDKEDYNDVDFHGRLIFSQSDFSDIADWAFQEKGALGYVTDWMMNISNFRSRFDIPDSLSYTRFDRSNETTYKTFGFVLSPRRGYELRTLCHKMELEHKVDPSKPQYPIATGFVNSEFKKGKLHLLVSEIKGKSDEVVTISAHLCHPRPCANDDASGCAGAMELMACLTELISKKQIPQPKYTIRMLLGAEITSTSAYLDSLSEEKRKKILAGVHFDMIGAKQGSGVGPVGLVRTPDMLPSFVNEVLEQCITENNYSHLNYAGEEIPEHHFHVYDHMSGSDHQVFCDPAIGIPCPALIQWPDVNFHTSGDTPDKIDKFQVRDFASACGGYLLALGDITDEAALGYIELVRVTFYRSVAKQTKIWRKKGENAETLMMRMKLKRECAVNSLNDMKRFVTSDQWDRIEPMIKREAEKYDIQIDEIISDNCSVMKKVNEIKLYNENLPQCPKRDKIGTITKDLLKDYLDKPEYKLVKAYMNRFGVTSAGDELNTVCYWMDGKHTVREIAEYTSIQYKKDQREFAKQFINLMVEAGLAHWEK